MYRELWLPIRAVGRLIFEVLENWTLDCLIVEICDVIRWWSWQIRLMRNDTTESWCLWPVRMQDGR